MIVHTKILIFTFVLFSFTINAQEVSNVHFEQVGKEIHIYYNLKGDGSYNVKVYCSEDGGNTWNKLRKVSGDVGFKVKQGRKKQIIWKVLDELDKLVGNVIFKITATSVYKEKPKTNKSNYKKRNRVIIARSWMGVKGGVNLSQTKFSNYTNGFNSNPFGYNLGFIYQEYSKTIAGFQFEALFDRYNIKMPNTKDLIISNFSYPLLAIFNFGKTNYRPFVLVGVPINLTISNYDDGGIGFLNFDFSIITGAGISIYLKENMAVNFELRYQYGLSELLQEENRVEEYGYSLKRNAISISIAFLWGL